MKRKYAPQLATSLIPLIGALVMSACGGGEGQQSNGDVTDFGADAQATLSTETAEDTAEAPAFESSRFHALSTPNGAELDAPTAAGGSNSKTIRLSENTFEKPEWDGTSFDNLNNKLECESSISRSTKVSRKGDSSIRFQVGLRDIICPNGRYRAEVSVSNGTPEDYVWDDPTPHWVGVSIYPRKFDNPAYTLLQIHSPNEKKSSNCDNEGNAVTLAPAKIDGRMHYALHVILDGSKRPEMRGAFTGSTRVWHEPMDTKGFTDFVLSFTLSTKKQGTVKLWRNGELVYSAKGLTNVIYTDTCGNRIAKRAHNGPHVGVYGPPAKGGSKERSKYGDPYREVFIDQLNTATGPDGYSLVDPAR